MKTAWKARCRGLLLLMVSCYVDGQGNIRNVAVFQHFKRLINIRRKGEPRQIVRYINPKEAELLDAAAGINVRFRLGGVKFPPEIYYKIFTHRHIEDLCANSPRDYTKLPAKHTSHIKSDDLQEEDYSGWYRRIENNGWRPVCETFWRPNENVMVGDKKESEFHFSKLKRRQDMEKKRKIRKIQWMQQMYYAGNLEAKSTNYETLGLIQTATKGLLRTIEDGGIDSVMEWEVDEVLNWTNTLNFDEYIANWKEIATSNSSANFKIKSIFIKKAQMQRNEQRKIYASNLDWSLMILYMLQFHSPQSFHLHPLPQSPKDCSKCLCLFCSLLYRVQVTIFLNSIYMR
ncbi:protein MFI isoform X1 [Moschus berezovskii]|uniref:protein MFI isoform X1 n=1 Tax=Moschus berezovskii TaxID=68408 RepID=UPI0024445F70|nr:protein MFI isoform X1 [Moschus berezovskii]